VVFEKSLTLGVNNLVEVTKQDITVGDGTAQRSRVESLSIQFDAEVTIAPGAFTVVKRGPDGGTVDVAYTTRLDEDGHTIADLTFSGTFVEYGSLVDGNYQLTIDGTNIETLDGFGFDSNQDGLIGDLLSFGQQESDNFYRYYGDGDGDRDVDYVDLLFFRRSLLKQPDDPLYRFWFDHDLDQDVDYVDYIFFRRNLLKAIQF